MTKLEPSRKDNENECALNRIDDSQGGKEEEEEEKDEEEECFVSSAPLEEATSIPPEFLLANYDSDESSPAVSDDDTDAILRASPIDTEEKHDRHVDDSESEADEANRIYPILEEEAPNEIDDDVFSASNDGETLRMVATPADEETDPSVRVRVVSRVESLCGELRRNSGFILMLLAAVVAMQAAHFWFSLDDAQT